MRNTGMNSQYTYNYFQPESAVKIKNAPKELKFRKSAIFFHGLHLCRECLQIYRRQACCGPKQQL